MRLAVHFEREGPAVPGMGLHCPLRTSLNTCVLQIDAFQNNALQQTACDATLSTTASNDDCRRDADEWIRLVAARRDCYTSCACR